MERKQLEISRSIFTGPKIQVKPTCYDFSQANHKVKKTFLDAKKKMVDCPCEKQMLSSSHSL